MLHLIFLIVQECLQCFKTKISVILIPPYWNFTFELMCDAIDTAIGVLLGQRKEKIFHPIYYTSRTLNSAQEIMQLLKTSFWLLSLHLINFVRI